jgi:hypothetical protein
MRQYREINNINEAKKSQRFMLPPSIEKDPEVIVAV